MKAMAVASGLSGFWQQDIEQAVNPLEALSQSPFEAGPTRAFWWWCWGTLQWSAVQQAMA